MNLYSRNPNLVSKVHKNTTFYNLAINNFFHNTLYHSSVLQKRLSYKSSFLSYILRVLTSIYSFLFSLTINVLRLADIGVHFTSYFHQQIETVGCLRRSELFETFMMYAMVHKMQEFKCLIPLIHVK